MLGGVGHVASGEQREDGRCRTQRVVHRASKPFMVVPKRTLSVTLLYSSLMHHIPIMLLKNLELLFKKCGKEKEGETCIKTQRGREIEKDEKKKKREK